MEPIAEVEVDLDEGELLFHEHSGHGPRIGADDDDDGLGGGAGGAAEAAAPASDSDSDEEIEDVGKTVAEPHDDEAADLVLDDGSAKSSTLNVSLEETVSRRAALPPRPRQHAVAASMPVASHVRMGSSVPIAVPNMSRWRQPAAAALPAAAGDSPVAGAQPAGFVPPHQFGTMVNDYTFSFTGDSPSMTMKRERLKARNAILKSTGFLEPGTGIINIAGLQERRMRTAGGLSQALQQGSAVAQ